MADQRTYGLDLSALDPETYFKVKKQLDRVSEIEDLREDIRTYRERGLWGWILLEIRKLFNREAAHN